jgi:dihydrofolate reductase
MGRLLYSAITSLDGYVADRNGNFDWAAPDAELHEFINDLERPIGTYLYGRRMYEVMAVWETVSAPREHPVALDYARLWRSAEKIVFSQTLGTVSSARTQIRRNFDPDEVRQLKADAATDLSVGGPKLAAAALRAGLIDECSLFIAPVVVGGGTAFLPDGINFRLKLLAERRFPSGFVYLSYGIGG